MTISKTCSGCGFVVSCHFVKSIQNSILVNVVVIVVATNNARDIVHDASFLTYIQYWKIFVYCYIQFIKENVSNELEWSVNIMRHQTFCSRLPSDIINLKCVVMQLVSFQRYH